MTNQPPMNWIKSLMTALFNLEKPETTFVEWFDSHKFNHFTGAEIARYFQSTRNGVRNSEPPREMWPNILPTMRIVDDLRMALGCPVRVTSSYRSPSYNATVGGAPRSQHKLFTACDIQVDGATPHEVALVLKEWRKLGRFRGGVGIYPTFVHIDTRGINATW